MDEKSPGGRIINYIERFPAWSSCAEAAPATQTIGVFTLSAISLAAHDCIPGDFRDIGYRPHNVVELPGVASLIIRVDVPF